MAFDCLVLCDELESLKVLCKAMDDAEINRDICTEFEEAVELLNRRKYEAVVVDCASIEQGGKFLRSVRRAPSNKQASVFALVAAEATAPATFHKGANFALLKPLSLDLVSRSLRAAHSLMLQERRRWFRHPIELAVELKRQRVATVHCVSRNLSEGGMGLRSANGISIGQEFEIRFRIPGEQNGIEGKCEVRWMDRAGNAGVRFLYLAQAEHKRLKDWLQEQFEKTPPSLFINSVKKLRRD